MLIVCSKAENDFLFHSFWGLNGLTNVCLIIWGKCREFIRYDQICDITKRYFGGCDVGCVNRCKSMCYGRGEFCDISQNDFGGGEMLSYREYFSNFADEICEVRLHLGNLKNNKI